MYARVARFENGDAEAMRQSAAEIRARDEGGPPPGIPAHELLVLQDTAAGATLAIALFESEEDYRQGHETLESMSPPGDGFGNRVAVEKYEVAVRFQP